MINKTKTEMTEAWAEYDKAYAALRDGRTAIVARREAEITKLETAIRTAPDGAAHDAAYTAWRDGRKTLHAEAEAEVTKLVNAVRAAHDRLTALENAAR